MRFKKALKWVCKALGAGCLALFVMTIFCMFYSNSPIHYPNASGATDYIWTPNAFYAQCQEGISHGQTNNEGFYNAFDYEPGMKIDILVMGSSHMEGSNVDQRENTASRLNALLPDKTVYNIGISGHTFLICCSNLEAALKTYRPAGYAAIETSKLNFTIDELDSFLNGTIPELTDHSSGILGFLSKNQFLRQLYHQYQSFMNQSPQEEEEVFTADAYRDTPEPEDNSEMLDHVLSRLDRTASAYDTEVIIFYHPSTQIDADGSLLLPDDAEDRAKFSELCEKNHIIFLDMTERFQYEYETNHILPHGFSNSSVGSGHLNRYGHEMIAEELYKSIN